jgi:hypothetical protein
LRTLACQPQADENAAPGTAKATANPKSINFYVNYRSGIIHRRHASIATTSRKNNRIEKGFATRPEVLAVVHI